MERCSRDTGEQTDEGLLSSCTRLPEDPPMATAKNSGSRLQVEQSLGPAWSPLCADPRFRKAEGSWPGALPGAQLLADQVPAHSVSLSVCLPCVRPVVKKVSRVE